MGDDFDPLRLQRAVAQTATPLPIQNQKTGNKEAERPEQRTYLDPGDTANELSFAIIGSAIDVHRALGPGHLERVYENALAVELRHRGYSVETQVPTEVLYRGVVVGQGRIDMIVNEWVVVEIKCVERLSTIHTIQALSYLKVTELPLALLINFNVSVLKQGVRRVIPQRR